MKMLGIAIFTLTKNRLEYTKRMFQSLEECTHLDYDHYVIDNSSTDGTKAWLEEHHGIYKVVFNENNRGLSVSWNQALDLIGSDYDYIIKLDNDCEILTDNWLKPMLEIAKEYEDKIILSPYIEGLRENKGGVPRYAHHNSCGFEIGLTKHLGGISLMVPTEAYRDFRLDEKMPLRGGQDGVFSKYAIGKGYIMAYVEDIRVSHMDTTIGQHEKFPDYFDLANAERRAIYNESSIITKLKKPYRRVKNSKIAQYWRGKY